jgi:hypothetical protein
MRFDPRASRALRAALLVIDVVTILFFATFFYALFNSRAGGALGDASVASSAVAAAVAFRILDVLELLSVAMFAALCKIPFSYVLRKLVTTTGAARFARR